MSVFYSQPSATNSFSSVGSDYISAIESEDEDLSNDVTGMTAIPLHPLQQQRLKSSNIGQAPQHLPPNPPTIVSLLSKSPYTTNANSSNYTETRNNPATDNLKTHSDTKINRLDSDISQPEPTNSNALTNNPNSISTPAPAHFSKITLLEPITQSPPTPTVTQISPSTPIYSTYSSSADEVTPKAEHIPLKSLAPPTTAQDSDTISQEGHSKNTASSNSKNPFLRPSISRGRLNSSNYPQSIINRYLINSELISTPVDPQFPRSSLSSSKTLSSSSEFKPNIAPNLISENKENSGRMSYPSDRYSGDSTYQSRSFNRNSSSEAANFSFINQNDQKGKRVRSEHSQEFGFNYNSGNNQQNFPTSQFDVVNKTAPTDNRPKFLFKHSSSTQSIQPDEIEYDNNPIANYSNQNNPSSDSAKNSTIRVILPSASSSSVSLPSSAISDFSTNNNNFNLSHPYNNEYNCNKIPSQNQNIAFNNNINPYPSYSYSVSNTNNNNRGKIVRINASAQVLQMNEFNSENLYMNRSYSSPNLDQQGEQAAAPNLIPGTSSQTNFPFHNFQQRYRPLSDSLASGNEKRAASGSSHSSISTRSSRYAPSASPKPRTLRTPSLLSRQPSNSSSKNSRLSQYSKGSRRSRINSRASHYSSSSISSISNILPGGIRQSHSNSSIRQSLVSSASNEDSNDEFDDALMGTEESAIAEDVITRSSQNIHTLTMLPAGPTTLTQGTPNDTVQPSNSVVDAPFGSRQIDVASTSNRNIKTNNGSPPRRSLDLERAERGEFSGIEISSEDEANFAATAQAAKELTEKRSTSILNEKIKILDENGNVICSPVMEGFMLFVFTLFPFLWLLMGCGVFDNIVGYVSLRSKAIALTLAFIFFIASIVGLVVGLVLGLNYS